MFSSCFFITAFHIVMTLRASSRWFGWISIVSLIMRIWWFFIWLIGLQKLKSILCLALRWCINNTEAVYFKHTCQLKEWVFSFQHFSRWGWVSNCTKRRRIISKKLTFVGKIYTQTDGVPMGSFLFPVKANLFKRHFEDETTFNNLATIYITG